MEFIKKIIRLTTQLFTLGFIIFSFFQLAKGVETVYIVDMLLCLGMLFMIIFGIVLNRSIYFHDEILNYIVPYILVMFILLGGIYIVNDLGFSQYIDIKIIALGFTIFYFIYSLIMMYKDKKKRNRIRF